MSESIWKIPYKKPDSQALEQAGIPRLLAEVLASRGIVSPSQAHALYSAGAASLLDPLEILGMKEARDRVLRAIRQKEHVTVYGDYDVDGITATCLLTDYLRSCGVDCRWYIPDRNDEGYGLNSSALQKLREEGCTLVISVDCGVTATEEAVFAQSLGLDLVITDHHECKNGSIPEACAVVDPKRPDDTYKNPHLAGVGVAFKLVSACSGDQLAVLERYADLVAVGTVADVMPLTGENRYLVQKGLQKLETDPRPGFYAIMNEPGTLPRKPNAGFIGFTLAPRLNAAGRLGQTEKAEELMLTEDAEEAARLTAELGELNRQRQKIENDIWRDAQKQLRTETPTGPIVLSAEGWHQGVIGIAAAAKALTSMKPSRPAASTWRDSAATRWPRGSPSAVIRLRASAVRSTAIMPSTVRSLSRMSAVTFCSATVPFSALKMSGRWTFWNPTEAQTPNRFSASATCCCSPPTVSVPRSSI